MSTLIVLFTLVWPSTPGVVLASESAHPATELGAENPTEIGFDDSFASMRYRGIERLLAQFEAQHTQNL